jgi:hypothetical protein
LRVTGLGTGLSVGLARWRPGRAVHDPGKIIADLVMALALGGDCLAVFADHGPAGSGEPLTVMLRARNAGSNTAADHIEATGLALAQLPAARRRQVLIRTDSAGGTQEFLAWLTKPGRRLTPTESPGPARGSRRSPACSAFHPGPKGCGSSSARNAPTPAHSCGSPTSTATGSPVSRPAPKAGSSLTWSYGTAAGRIARGGRHLRLRLTARWPWAQDIVTAMTRLQALPSG